MARLKQAYDYYVRSYFNENGQNLIEYALLLAIVVGIGYLIYQNSGLQTSITDIFKNADAAVYTALPGTQHAHPRT